MGTINEDDGVNYTGKIKGEFIPPNKNLKELLSGRKMKELQDFGARFGIKDNVKIELVDKILANAPNEDIINFIEVK